MNYAEFQKKNVSEKIVLVWLEPSQRVFGWVQVFESNVWMRTLDHFPIAVKVNNKPTEVVSAYEGLTEDGQVFFDRTVNTVFLYSDTNPNTDWVEVFYRLFFSNAPINLPWDLGSGREVPYEARLQSTSKFKSSFDSEQKGIALEGQGTVTIENRDGFFSTIYDRLTWENKPVRVFSYGRGVNPSDAITLFFGSITNKSYSDSRVQFRIRDFIYRLRTVIDMPLYEAEDGNLPGSLIGKPKRRVYGRVNGLKCDPISLRGADPYPLVEIEDDLRTDTPITVSLSQGSNVLTASSADIHEEIVAGDTLLVANQSLVVKSLSRVDFGMSGTREIQFTLTGSATVRMAFTSGNPMVVSSIEIGDHISLVGLSNAGTALKDRIIGHFPISSVGEDYIEFTLPSTVSDEGFTDPVKVGVGEVCITKSTNAPAVFLQSASNVTVSNRPCLIDTDHPYRRFNRNYLLTHHALSNATKTITSVMTGLRIALDNVDDLQAGDIIRFESGTLSEIASINTTSRVVEVTSTILPIPPALSKITRLGIQRVTHKRDVFTPFRDYTPDFVEGVGTSISFDPLAEFSAATARTFDSTAHWLNGSKQVVGSNSIFRSLRPRDWVRSETDGEWYEIAEKFSDNVIILSKPYVGLTGNNTTLYKQPQIITDDSVVIANVCGKTDDGTPEGKLLDTAPRVVRDLLREIELGDRINEESFEEASETIPYMMSLAIPNDHGSEPPVLRETINQINDSVIGSIYNDIDMRICYRILDATRSLDKARRLTDLDVISGVEVSTDSSKTLAKIVMRYGFRDADVVTEEPVFEVTEQVSEFVEMSGTDGSTRSARAYLLHESDAVAIAQRYVFMNEVSKSAITIQTKLALADVVLNDLITLDLDNLYRRFGTSGADTSKTGLVNSIDKNGLGVVVEIDDLGNIFNRVAVIAPDSANNYADASELERRFSGYITDDSGLVDDNPETFNANLIG